MGTALAALVSITLVLSAPLAVAQAGDALIKSYIDAWRDFYPSRAFAYGDVASAGAFEDLSDQRVTQWLALNEDTLSRARLLLADEKNRASVIDLSVLLGQAEDELAHWREDQPLQQQPQWYAEIVSQALTHLLVRDQLTAPQRRTAALRRLLGVARLCRQGAESLSGGNTLRIQRALRTLAGARAFYGQGLSPLLMQPPGADADPELTAAINEATSSILTLEQHLQNSVLGKASASPAMDQAAYAAKLARRTAGLYTPDRLRATARAEVEAVRALMLVESTRWRESVTDEAERAPLAALEGQDLLSAAIEAMESDRQENSADFLASFTELTFAAERFVEEKRLATIPKPTTLYVALSPAHFSGAAVGGVYPSGPFAPEADTLFYIPSIPDNAPDNAKEGFYRSFNTHFNTMILSHEMFPGHYLQYKVAVTEAPAVRSLFANGSYIEGWGSFVEELMLDAGWADDAPLTRLAHLRKRLENATRAYVSVQVNTAGWQEAQVLEFARDEGLLAPQFAVNLWQRVVNSPMQITDYMTGYLEFKRLYGAYRAQPENLGIRPWVDAVLQAGPVPMTLLESML